MVVLNDIISFNMKKLRTNLPLDVKNFIYKSLDYYLKDGKIDEIAEKVEKYIKEKLIEDHFIYINMNNNHCTHKYKKGKKDGEYCCKKITNNGNRHKYVCTRHNKEHVPKKRLNKKLKNFENFGNCKNYKDINKSIIKIDNKISHLRKNKKLKNNKKNKKIFICNSGLIDFKKIFKDIL